MKNLGLILASLVLFTSVSFANPIVKKNVKQENSKTAKKDAKKDDKKDAKKDDKKDTKKTDGKAGKKDAQRNSNEGTTTK